MSKEFKLNDVRSSSLSSNGVDPLLIFLYLINIGGFEMLMTTNSLPLSLSLRVVWLLEAAMCANCKKSATGKMQISTDVARFVFA